MDQNNRNNRNRGDKNRRRGGGMWSIVLWALLLTIGVNYVSVMLEQARAAESSCEIAHSELVDLVESGKVKSIEIGDNVYTITPVDGFVYTDDDGKSYNQDYTLFTTIIPAMSESLLSLCDEEGVTYTKPYQAPISPVLAFMVTYILPTVLMVGAFVLLMNLLAKKSGGMGGIGGIGNVGKANAKVYMEKSTGVTFADVAGQDEAKESLVEIIDFLHNPEKYTAIGAKIPKGALLVGSPGTGKTLLAKAVAGEAKVPFFSISGSDFVEMFVGVGASRVRSLFEQAKKNMPCIVFIDEIDAVGRHRGAGLGGGNDEREQTLNQLLVEMDGFETNSGIIVMAATNRPDVLDPALMRPGRFDRQIFVNRPDVRGREAILKVHARNKPIDATVDFKTIARITSGFTGADLENCLNEAAILAARDNRRQITMADVNEGITKMEMGPAKKSRLVTEHDKRITAYHEAGHAILACSLKNCEPVHEVTIIPRGMAAGFTMTRPENDNEHVSKAYLLDNITMTLGGRIAEELVIEDYCTGASGDIKALTERCRKMVTEWGMSEKVGLLYYGGEQEVFVGRDYHSTQGYSEETAAEIDEEIKSIICDAYDKTKKVLSEHIDLLHRLAGVLFEREKLDADEFLDVMNGKLLPSAQTAAAGIIPAEAAAPETTELPTEAQTEPEANTNE